jgi:hypothetical protein
MVPIATLSVQPEIVRFKLHLQPRTRTSQSVSEAIPPLPPGKTAVDVFSDFLRYLDTCFKQYIEETHAAGARLITSSKINYILSHPNGWEGAQQSLMRQAAVQAGLVSSSLEDQENISFITEGEASLNFCIEKGLMNDSISVSLRWKYLSIVRRHPISKGMVL